MEFNPLLGNIKRQLDELYAYSMSLFDWRMEHHGLKKEDITYLSPRMVPANRKEMLDFPSGSSLVGDKEEIRKLLRRGHSFIQEPEAKDKLLDLARKLAENMHNLGQMDKQKFARVMKNITQAKIIPISAQIQRDILSAIEPNPASSGPTAPKEPPSF